MTDQVPVRLLDFTGSTSTDLPAGLNHTTIIAYLRAAPVVYVARPANFKNLPPTESVRSTVAWFTDGTWVWNSTFLAALEHGRTDLPAEFMDAVRPHVHPDPQPEAIESAIALAKSLAASPVSAVATHYATQAASGLLDLVRFGASNPDRGPFTMAWSRLIDSIGSDSLPALVRRLLSRLVETLPVPGSDGSPSAPEGAHTGPSADAIVFTLFTSTSRQAPARVPTLHPLPAEYIDELLRWSRGLPIDSLYSDETTRVYHGVVLAAALLAHLTASSIEPDLSAMLS
jgi:hypothetical protein